ncbi:MAG: endoribonuclease MazF [Chloroflexota bacterium]
MSYAPELGDAVWLNFNPQAGHEQAGRRPALILTPKAYNEKVGLVICCPITSQVKGYPFEVPIPAGLAISGVILSDQVKSLDWRVRQAKQICSLPETTVTQVLRKLHTLLGTPTLLNRD